MTTLPSSSTSGFFQVLPTLRPQYTHQNATGNQTDSPDDAVLARILQLYLPALFHDETSRALDKLSHKVLERTTLDHSVDAETNVPFLKPLTTFGEENRNDPLHTSAGWKALKDIGIEQGVVSRAYDDDTKGDYNRRIVQFAVNHLWSPTATLTMCPMSMTDGAATLLSRHLNDPDGDHPGRGAVLKELYRRLISSDPRTAWTSGQWMTERTGGSDVSGTETMARKLSKEEAEQDRREERVEDAIGLPLGPWRIDGFKWFSSATDSDMTVLLAQTPKGLSAFFMPLRRNAGSKGASSTELNGVRIQRLKNKMGTKGLPTAELELKGARAWLIGEEGKGIREVAAILNITRIHTAMGSSSYWARGLAICRAYSKVRKTRGHFLHENVQHVRWMATETTKYWASTQLGFFGCALLGAQEQGWDSTTKGTKAEMLIPKDKTTVDMLLRLLTPVMKSQVSMAAVAGLRSAMECLGGVGYCENTEDGGILNIARIFRDSVVQTIWEGTVSVMAEDVGRVLKDKRLAQGKILENVFCPWVDGILRTCQSRFPQECAVVQEWEATLLAMTTKIEAAELEWRGREVLELLEAITISTILLYDAIVDGDEVAYLVAIRYVRSIALPKSSHGLSQSDWQKESATDLKIFLGPKFSPTSDPKSRL